MAERRAWDRRRWLESAFVAIVCAGALWAAWGFWYDRHFPDRLTRVQLGMDRKSVEAVLGRPRWAGSCAGRVDYLPRADCSTELGYSSAFAPLRPVYYIVQLDRNERVIEAEPARSR
ncbi:MAG TPA: hypothetical protein VE053_11130 [Allosphingosinicella sp.]|nr:hypothetical protein [Allosphingosinicella sp.]